MTISPAQGIRGNDIIPLSSLKLIGITGHAGTGKDTIADYIQQNYKDCYIESFAKPLKAACAAAFGLPVEYFNDRELKEQEVFWGTTPRKIAQFVGTEMFRESVHSLYNEREVFNYPAGHWINLLQARLTGQSAPPEGEGFYEPGETIIIPDVRFQDEADWIWNNNGIVIKVTREGCYGAVGLPGHSSEAGVTTDFKYQKNHLIINNGTKKELYETVESFIHFYRDYLSLEREPESEKPKTGFHESDF
jgi:hypothetical protein